MNIDKLLDYIGWTFLVATILFLRISEQLLDNIIKAKSFLIEYALYGAFFSATVLFLFYKTNPNYYKGGEKRASAILSYFFGVTALFVFGTTYYNFQTAKKNPRELKAYVSDKTKNFRYGTNYLILDFDNRTERFQPTKKEWEKIETNDTILLTVGQGQLGYEHILTFK